MTVFEKALTEEVHVNIILLVSDRLLREGARGRH